MILFEHLSGLKINFHKSDVCCFGEAGNDLEKYKEIFTCNTGSLPLKYLGIPVHAARLRNSDWNKAEHKIESKLGTRQGKFLDYGGKLILIRSIQAILAFCLLQD